jgi:hypothetical protein
MKTKALLSATVLSVLLVGCDYTVPLVKNPVLPLDQSVLGLWKRSDAQGRTEALLVLPLGKTEYLVSYPAGTEGAMFARGCLCPVDNRTWVQLQWIGTAEGKPAQDDRVYQFAVYSVNSNSLAVRLLNPDVVKGDVKTAESLAKSMADNEANPGLLKEELVFRRVRATE